MANAKVLIGRSTRSPSARYRTPETVIAHFSREQFHLTYGFCSKDLKPFLAQKNSEMGIKNGQFDPSRDQYMAHEKHRNSKYYCDRLCAACDFQILGLESDLLVEWILEQRLPFDSLYYYKSK